MATETNSATKLCQRCGKQFSRTVFKSGRIEGKSIFERRVHCGRKCSENKWRSFVI